jgi:hypothetical protein
VINQRIIKAILILTVSSISTPSIGDSSFRNLTQIQQSQIKECVDLVEDDFKYLKTNASNQENLLIHQNSYNAYIRGADCIEKIEDLPKGLNSFDAYAELTRITKPVLPFIMERIVDNLETGNKTLACEQITGIQEKLLFIKVQFDTFKSTKPNVSNKFSFYKQIQLIGDMSQTHCQNYIKPLTKHTCGNVKGHYYTNSDNSKGGFVENTAHVDNNNPAIYIGSEASICEYATLNNGKVIGNATLTGDHIMNSGIAGGSATLIGGVNNGATFVGNSKQTGGVAEYWQKFTGGYVYTGEKAMFQKVMDLYYEISEVNRTQEVFTAPNYTTEEIKFKQNLGILEQKIVTQIEINVNQKNIGNNQVADLKKEYKSLKEKISKTEKQIKILEKQLEDAK